MNLPSASTLLNRLSAKAKFRHMLVLIKLAELGSMRRAALAVNMTQPAVSQMVAELETLLETPLFFRHARGVRPNDVTTALLPVARRILQSVEDCAEAVAGTLRQQTGVVRVSASPAAMNGILEPSVIGFAKSHPDTQLHVFEELAGDPLAAITNGSADIVVTREPAVVPKGWVFQPVLMDELIIVCRDQHPLATADNCKPSELADQIWLSNRVGSVARQRLEELAFEHGWPEENRCGVIVHIPEMTRKLLMESDYLVVVPKSVARPWLDSGDLVQIQPRLTTSLSPLGFVMPEQGAFKSLRQFVDFFG